MRGTPKGTTLHGLRDFVLCFRRQDGPESIAPLVIDLYRVFPFSYHRRNLIKSFFYIHL